MKAFCRLCGTLVGFFADAADLKAKREIPGQGGLAACGVCSSQGSGRGPDPSTLEALKKLHSTGGAFVDEAGSVIATGTTPV